MITLVIVQPKLQCRSVTVCRSAQVAPLNHATLSPHRANMAEKQIKCKAHQDQMAPAAQVLSHSLLESFSRTSTASYSKCWVPMTRFTPHTAYDDITSPDHAHAHQGCGHTRRLTGQLHMLPQRTLRRCICAWHTSAHSMGQPSHSSKHT
jgi:hypothetical protein